MRPFHCAALAFGVVCASTLASAFDTVVAAKDANSGLLGSCAGYSGLPEDGDTAEMSFIPARTFSMGSNRHRPEERYTHIVRVDGFWIDRQVWIDVAKGFLSQRAAWVQTALERLKE